MTRTYTADEEAWLRDHYPEGTIDDTLDAFEREFGRRPSKQAIFVKANKMGLRKKQHYDERHVPKQKTMRWSSPEFEREREWMLANDVGESVFGTIDAFEREFGVRLNRNQVSLFRSTYGTGRRVSHGGGKPSKPVGSERLGKDGYIMVKVKEWPDKPCSKDNWRFKHHVEYEKAYGPIPEGHVVLFADKDRRNFDPANLVAVPRKYICQLNNPELPGYHDRDSLLACIALCDLRSKLMDVENERPRECAVCGATFTPTREQRSQPNPVQTCPDCLAAGKRARGRRGDGQPTVCAVCGEVFAREMRTQRRCPACKAAMPNYGVDQHRSYFERNGHR